MDPIIQLPQGAQEEVFATSTMKKPIVLAKTASTATCVTNVAGHIRDVDAPPFCHQSQREMKKITNAEMVPRLAENKNDPLPTPVLVHKLEAALSNHPNTTFVSELCNIFRQGAHIGFQGQRSARFSRNLPTVSERRSFGKFS